MRKTEVDFYHPEGHWLGRSLENYLSNFPKAKGAKTLTEARRMAFGAKKKSFSCKCGNDRCARLNGGGSHC